ncbi:hypothetical protein LA080_013990 [Diaporthe eres]|nr:hypothetical protein LA080_013990 [Diaporthe eres]
MAFSDTSITCRVYTKARNSSCGCREVGARRGPNSTPIVPCFYQGRVEGKWIQPPEWLRIFPSSPKASTSSRAYSRSPHPVRAARVTWPEQSLEIAECYKKDASSGESWSQKKDPQASWARIEDDDWLMSAIQHQRTSMRRFEKSPPPKALKDSLHHLFQWPLCGPYFISSRKCLNRYAIIGTRSSTGSNERTQLV